MNNSHIKDHYDREVPSLSGGHYEQYRWFNHPIQTANFTMTKAVITNNLLDKFFTATSILEIGPGPGTWTEVLLQRLPTASFTLVDISEQMLKEAAQRLATRGKFTFINQDFTTFTSNQQYDLIFSSRAIEYAEDKKPFINNLAKLLAPGGTGFIITKTPHYFRERLRGRRVPTRHRQQLKWRQLQHLLTEAGLTVLNSYPVTVSVPFLHSAKINLLVAKLLNYLPLNFITLNLTESYALKFAKQEIVEVFGLPGSGKTTYAKDLEHQGYRRIKVRTKWELIRYNVIFFLRYPGKFVRGLFYLIRYAGSSRWWYYKLMNLFFQHNAKWIKATQQARAVLDQGHFQNILSLFDHPISSQILNNYIKILPRPDKLIILDLPVETRDKILNHRQQRPREELGEVNKEWVRSAETNFSTFKTIWREWVL